MKRAPHLHGSVVSYRCDDAAGARDRAHLLDGSVMPYRSDDAPERRDRAHLLRASVASRRDRSAWRTHRLSRLTAAVSRRASSACVIVVLLLCASPAWAWESICKKYVDPSLEVSALTNPQPCEPEAGPSTARNRWVGPLDEHRLLFEKTRELAGIPAAVSATQHLRVFTSSGVIPLGTASGTSLFPVDFATAERAQTRAFAIGELAQLPDFSYSLWDWAQGHETCPLDGVGASAEECHDFASHMGPVNANHFLPLAQVFYTRYHTLAVQRAGECNQMKTALGAAASRLDAYSKACEIEALAIEAVAQHYMQDAWSMGHMWQRWGSPDLTDFPGGTELEKRERAVLIALASGLLHGARGVLQKLPNWTSYDVNDALCAPHPSVRYVHPTDGVKPAIGDDYLGLLQGMGGDATYSDQWRKLASCSVSGVLAVYRAAGENHGVATPDASLQSVDPVSDECFGQRATNAAMLAAAAVNLKVAGAQTTLNLDSSTVSWMLPRVATSEGSVPVSAQTKNRFRHGLQRIVSMTRLHAKRTPDGTEVADGALGAFLGVDPNGVFTNKAQIASYFEPPLPWPANGGNSAEQDRARSLSRLFHRGHAKDWCEAIDGAALTTLKTRATNETDAEIKAAACEACAEISVRHLRIGTDSTTYDTTREPVCTFLTGGPALVYQPGNSSDEPVALARAYCGCP